MSRLSEKEFKEWLDKEGSQLLTIEDDDNLTACAKLPLADGFDAVYAKGDFQLNIFPKMYASMQFVGVYNREEGKIYPQHWIMQRVYPNLTHKKLMQTMARNIIPQVRECVENMLNGNCDRLTIKELSSVGKQLLESYKANALEMDVKRAFVNDVKSEDIRYECEYDFSVGDGNKMLDYIHDSFLLVQGEAEEYIENNEEAILLQFKKKALKKEGLRTLEENADESILRLRGVYQALLKADKDTVTITMEKDGEQVQFRYKAKRFSKSLCLFFDDVRPQYQGDIAKILEGAILPHENIVDITYENKCLYSAEPYEPEQGNGMEQKM